MIKSYHEAALECDGMCRQQIIDWLDNLFVAWQWSFCFIEFFEAMKKWEDPNG